jgi:hypothetical protein
LLKMYPLGVNINILPLVEGVTVDYHTQNLF